MRRTDSDKSMETVHLSEEPTNNYEEITVQLRPLSKEIPRVQWHETQRCKIAGVVFCVAASATIFVVILVELVNSVKGNPYL
jgi:hypothetical protein